MDICANASTRLDGRTEETAEYLVYANVGSFSYPVGPFPTEDEAIKVAKEIVHGDVDCFKTQHGNLVILSGYPESVEVAKIYKYSDKEEDHGEHQDD